MALVLADACLERFGGDSIDDVRSRYAGWQRQVRQRFAPLKEPGAP